MGLLRRYIRAGWAVLLLFATFDGGCVCPAGSECASPGKHPRSRHGLDDATTNERELQRLLRRWPESNFGVVSGPETACVIDVDGPEGVEALGRYTARYGPLPNGVGIVHTGRGAHLYFAGADVPNRAGILPHVDVRGRRGYCVVPPSVHVSGARYRWERGIVPEVSALPPLTPWLRELIQPPRPAAAITLPRPGDQRYGLAALRSECESVATTPQGCRNHQLNASAFAIGQLVGAGLLDAETALAALIGAGINAGLPERECRTTSASGLKAGMTHPREVAS